MVKKWSTPRAQDLLNEDFLEALGTPESLAGIVEEDPVAAAAVIWSRGQPAEPVWGFQEFLVACQKGQDWLAVPEEGPAGRKQNNLRKGPVRGWPRH